jgi:hypothetical protein
MYEEATTEVRTSEGVTEKFTVKFGLHQGSALSPYLFVLIMDVLGQDKIQPSPWNLIFADDILLIDNTREGVEEQLERWRRVMEERGLKISRKKDIWWLGKYMVVGKVEDNVKCQATK